jgi:hypothetical protein
VNRQTRQSWCVLMQAILCYRSHCLPFRLCNHVNQRSVFTRAELTLADWHQHHVPEQYDIALPGRNSRTVTVIPLLLVLLARSLSKNLIYNAWQGVQSNSCKIGHITDVLVTAVTYGLYALLATQKYECFVVTKTAVKKYFYQLVGG